MKGRSFGARWNCSLKTGEGRSLRITEDVVLHETGNRISFYDSWTSGNTDKPGKVQVIQSCPLPKALTELKSLIGLLQFFRHFITNFSDVAAPFTPSTRKGSGIHAWYKTFDESFSIFEEAITTTPVLIARNWKKIIRMPCWRFTAFCGRYFDAARWTWEG